MTLWPNLRVSPKLGGMSSSLGLTPEIIRYLAHVNPPEHPVLVRCREETQELPMARMQISAEQGAFMQVIARMLNAKHVFEVGVFTGYSSTAVALTMNELHPVGAKLLACDISEEWTTKARDYWREAQVDGIIDLVIAPASETGLGRASTAFTPGSMTRRSSWSTMPSA